MSGADLKTYIPQITELQQQISKGEVDEIDGCKLRDGTDAVLRSLKIYKPIIAAVDGPCVAGGMEMLGGVDIRVATERAVFGVMEPKRGLFAGGGTTVRLPRQLAYPAAMEFLLTAEAFPASRALELGLLNEIVPTDELARARPRLGGAHQRQRAARRAGDQGERAARPGRRPEGGVQDRERTRREDLLEQRRQGRPQGVRGKARPEVDRHSESSTRARRASSAWRSAPSVRPTARRPNRSRCGTTCAAVAAADCGASSDVLAAADSLQIVYCMAWPYDAPVDRLADSLGIAPRHRFYSGIGGTTPQVLVEDAAAVDPRRRDGPRGDHRRRGARDQAAGEEGGRAPRVELQGREPARRSRSRRRSTPPRSRTTCSRRGSRSRCSTSPAAPGSASLPTTYRHADRRNCSRR